MPKPPKAGPTDEAKRRGQDSAGKLRLYEILCTLNQGFEQVLGQLQQLESSAGAPAVECLRVIVEEKQCRGQLRTGRAARGTRREGLDLLWPPARRAREEASRSRDVLIEADPMRQQMKKRLAQRRGTPQQTARRSPGAFAPANPASLSKLIWNSEKSAGD